MIHAGKLTVIAAMLAVLGACGEKGSGTPAAMKVNGETIAAAEVEERMQQYRHLSAEQKASVSEKILASLADSEMLRQAAAKEKLDQESALKVRLNGAIRLIMANAYIDKTMAAVPKPNATEVKDFFTKNPARFGDRKIYDLQEINIPTSPESAAEIDKILKSAVKPVDFMAWLQERKIQHTIQPLVVEAEKILEPILQKLSHAKAGDIISLPNKDKITVLLVNNIQTQPLSLEQATSLIEGQLYEERKAASMAAMLKQLREKTKVEYLPPYKSGTGDVTKH